ncbi:hypothetical protein PM3016_5003 [Paenibacillus mucilaginosus 3016]|uniref:DUF2809 domain-containing protein n=3 Tax=Paenibacillus mucilaginosus TaxID=61624 RepID=H6NN59_9BACL|nr:DUF2809 domain-containing protein [Paenibacillus mucilaginosus]AEI44183.1 hypothetical protein KNP414_05659 [Paenibacillus mucilaginosus KNP414]AFC31735.1 hypothetical protein PM3016_5003 [Paenibacillus mucilaginosus 3016]WDM25598.1 DUF2809 domain-containing protein [Paenibacillus mucilaginosus]WFA20258.1 DUF2809 domain-containing protein [Paenibacillus mucilaginosus]
MPSARGRWAYAGITLLVMALGLASRVFGDRLPAFAAAHLGDALWAAMIYFGCRCLFLPRGARFAAGLSLLLSFGIEASQLYRSPWIDALRATTPGALVLGHGFLWIDLARYAAGIAAAYGLDPWRLCR